MSKDPAFLFYSSDFLTGCLDLDMEERGQYITLLCLQHQKGHISEKTIRLCVGSVSDSVLSKFSKDSDGLFFNSRLEEVIEKRKYFTESRRKNGALGGRPSKDKKPSDKPSDKPSENLPENENINEIINKLKDILVKYYNREFVTKSWNDDIKKMIIIDKIPKERIINALDWYSKNIGGEYIPVIQSGSSFREKYTKLENAMKKKKNTFGNWSDF